MVRKFRGIAGPKGLPAEIISHWERAIEAVLENPGYQAVYEADNLRPDYLDHDQYIFFIDDFVMETESFLRGAGIIR